jgi:heme exporter protein D
MSLREFLHMGGYGTYIWTSYGLTLVALIWNFVAARRELTKQILLAKRRVQVSGGEVS